MFRPPACVSLPLIAVALLSATSHAQTLPAVALIDDVAAIARIDLKAVDLVAGKQAAASAFEKPNVTLAPLLLKYELNRRMLMTLGVDVVVIAVPTPKPAADEPAQVIEDGDTITLPEPEQPQRALVLVHVPGDHAAAKTDDIAVLTLQMSAHDYQWGWQDEWLVLNAKSQPLDPEAKRGRNAERFEQGLEFLGRRPGIVVVPTGAMRKQFDQVKPNVKKNFPASLADSADQLLTASWIAMVAKLGSDASIKFVVQMPDEPCAKRLESSFGRLQKDLAKWAGPKPTDDHPVPLLIQSIKLIDSWQLLRSSSQTGFVLDAGQFGRLVEVAYIDSIYLAMELAIGKKRPWRSLLPLTVWIESYRLMAQKMPDSLDDLKLLLGSTQAEQDDHLRRLLTNSATGDYPSVAYIKVPLPKLDDKDDPVMLREMKDGEVLKDGIAIRRSGWMDIGHARIEDDLEDSDVPKFEPAD